MKLVFFSNFLNHHQLPFCMEMIRLLGKENFYFVANNSSNPVCIALGYDEMNNQYPFVIRAYESEKAKIQAMELARTSDVAIIGAFSEEYLRVRMKLGLLTFVFSERFFRDYGKKHSLLFNIRTRFEVFRNYSVYRRKPLYFLCAGGYVHKDLKECGFPIEKCLKWGYFPKTVYYDEGFLLNKHKSDLKFKTVSILCVGRLIGWKHPELPVLLAEKLKQDGVDFNLVYVGDGELREKLEHMVIDRGLESLVFFVGPKPYLEVRSYMENSDIFLFTSDHNEGWGAVLNEAMNSACAVIACDKIGSAPILIDNGVNGLLFDGSLNDLYIKTLSICKDSTLRGLLGYNAYYTISNIWNAERASESLLCTINALLGLESVNISEGPCSSFLG